MPMLIVSFLNIFDGPFPLSWPNITRDPVTWQVELDVGVGWEWDRSGNTFSQCSPEGV